MGGRPVGHLQSVMELSSGLLKTNPASGREEDLNLRPQDYKSGVLKSCYTSDFLLVMGFLFSKMLHCQCAVSIAVSFIKTTGLKFYWKYYENANMKNESIYWDGYLKGLLLRPKKRLTCRGMRIIVSLN